MPELLGDVDGVVAESEAKTRVGSAQAVEGRRADRLLPASLELNVSRRDARFEDPLTDSVAIERAEDPVVGSGSRLVGPERCELVDQGRGQIDVASTRRGLRIANADTERREAHIEPAQVESLANAQPGSSEQSQERARNLPVVTGAAAGGAQGLCRVEQRRELLGFDVGPRRRGCPKASTASGRWVRWD
ncbi:hypothetical protein HJD18_08190 [Thermoleophilia bacterium SCSIO 60948]|nr:hypothetical protein HJD18_08190 [Thermoleophilia bacterium SCSIO 60948]